MTSFLIMPEAAGPWRVATDELSEWLSQTWEATPRDGGVGQRAFVWELPDHTEVWVPDDREVVWAEATKPVLASLAVWCSKRSSQPLILTDEGYSNPIELAGLSEADVAAALQ